MIMYNQKRAQGNLENKLHRNVKKIWRKYLMFIMNLMVRMIDLAERAEINFK